MEFNGDPEFSNGHYNFKTLRTTFRDLIPDKSKFDPNWKIECQNQAAPIWNLKSPSLINYGLVSSCFQGSIRQCNIIESIQWAMEMLKTDADLNSRDTIINGKVMKRKVGKGENNFYTRAFIITVEDIGLANPYMVVLAAQVARGGFTYATYDDAERAAINMTIMLAKSVKSRICDWACIARLPIPDNLPFSLEHNYVKLVECLANGNYLAAIAYVESFITQSLYDKENKEKDPLDKSLFSRLTEGVHHRGEPIKFYKNKRQLIWVAFAKVINSFVENNNYKYPVVREIVESCYDLAHHDTYRWGIPARLFGRMAVLSICLRDEIEKRGLNPKWAPVEIMPDGRDFNVEEIEILRKSHADGNLWFGIPNIFKDKHCSEGKQLGRNIQHFVEIKSFLRYEDPTLIPLSDMFLQKCFETRYSRENNGYFDNSGLTIADYIKWLPQLRENHKKLNLIEDFILKQTITITFCNRGESHVGMQMIGKDVDQGFTCSELIAIHNSCKDRGVKSEYRDLKMGILENGNYLCDAQEAGILILRGVGNMLIPGDNGMPGMDCLLLELASLNWDKMAFMKGKVVNKHARWNLCFADFNQEPEYENGKGRIIDYKDVKLLGGLQKLLGNCFGSKAKDLVAEGNYYYDTKKCYISKHGDSERKIVIGVRIGKNMSLEYQWYIKSEEIGKPMRFILNHGDMYIMSQKAVGADWKLKNTATLRHSANCENVKGKK